MRAPGVSYTLRCLLPARGITVPLAGGDDGSCARRPVRDDLLGRCVNFFRCDERNRAETHRAEGVDGEAERKTPRRVRKVRNAERIVFAIRKIYNLDTNASQGSC